MAKGTKSNHDDVADVGANESGRVVGGEETPPILDKKFLVGPAAVVVLLSSVICTIVLGVEITGLKSEKDMLISNYNSMKTAVDVLLQQRAENFSETIDILQTQDNFIRMLYEQLRHQNESDVAMFAKLAVLHESIHSILNDTVFGNRLNPITSCATLSSTSPSGHYWIRASNGSAAHTYCDMDISCGGVTGGWRRVAELDLADTNQSCPGNLRLQINSFGNRSCSSLLRGCSSIPIATAPWQYSEVCGRITGYQLGSAGSFNSGIENPTIDDNYMDGVILTFGTPRQHIWSFAAGHDESSARNIRNCPCIDSGTSIPPVFVGNDYFCDTSRENQNVTSDDPLWDGTGCGPSNTCCSFNNPPWFYKQMPWSTHEEIEMRVCNSEGNRVVGVEYIELLIR